LLGLYARNAANSRERAWSCGGLLPNDLGLFDMLGNQFEWVNDRFGVTRPGRHGVYVDIIYKLEYINNENIRLLRGGSFLFQPRFVRSALRDRYAPSYCNSYVGFRPARTHP
jgi:formylglycine-generating enzyme required for sulfatase activity